MVELIGYAGSALVAVSLMMSNIWRLRWINLAGAALFTVYGLAVRAYPVAAVNALIMVIDAYYLGAMAARKDFFRLMPVASPDEALFKGFCERYREDIERFFPGFAFHRIPRARCVFTLRNLQPVGLFVYEEEGGEAVRIHLDYVAPEYRDLRNARFLYSVQAADFKERGFREFRVKAGTPAIEGYLRRMGFQAVPGDPGAFTSVIADSRRP